MVNRFCQIGRESDYVVIQGLLEFFATFEGKGGLGSYNVKVGFGDDTFGHEGFAGQQFDLQPDLKFALFRPDVAHLRTRVALNHVT